MHVYNEGILSVVDGSLIFIKNNIAKVLFEFPKDDPLDDIFIESTNCGAIIITLFDNGKEKLLYCFREGHAKTVPQTKNPTQILIQENGSVLATFHPHFSVFNLDEITDIKRFGSCILFINATMMYFYSINYKSAKLEVPMPTLPLVWKNKRNDIAIMQLCLIEPISQSIQLANHFIFLQGICAYNFYDYGITFYHNYWKPGELFLGAEIKDTLVCEIGLVTEEGWLKKWNVKTGIVTEHESIVIAKNYPKSMRIKVQPELQIEGEIEGEDEIIIHGQSDDEDQHNRQIDDKSVKTLLDDNHKIADESEDIDLDIEEINLEEKSSDQGKFDIECKIEDKIYKFCLPSDEQIFDYHEVPGGLIVLTQSFVDPLHFFCVDLYEPTYKFQLGLVQTSSNNETSDCCKILVVHSDYWVTCKPNYFQNGILQYNADKWYYFSIEHQFEVEIDFENHDFVHITTVGDNKYLWYELHDEFQKCSFFKLYKIKSLNCVDHKFELEIVNAEKKSLIKGINGFYYFDGHKFSEFHEKVNLFLRDLTEDQIKKLDIDELALNSMDVDFVDNLRTSLVLRTLDKNLNRKYRLSPKPYDEAIVAFTEGEEYLDTVILARKVNRYHSKFTFALIDSSGRGPVRVVSNTIIKEFVNRYFKYDGCFLIPTTFRNLTSEEKFNLGWIVHNILYITKVPIGCHLPLALLSTLIKREPEEAELEMFAKATDEITYNMLNKLDELSIKAAGYNTRFEWLSMICRYSKKDLELYDSFADGFISFSAENPLKGANLLTADYFISGANTLDLSEMISKLISSSEGTIYELCSEKLVARLVSASEVDIKNFVFNLNGTYHLDGSENVVFGDPEGGVDYKFGVCFNTLTISTKIKPENFDYLIDELFKIQPKMRG
jgi:hypothetical protein